MLVAQPVAFFSSQISLRPRSLSLTNDVALRLPAGPSPEEPGNNSLNHSSLWETMVVLVVFEWLIDENYLMVKLMID